MRYIFIFCLLTVSLAGCSQRSLHTASAKAKINRVLNDWHHAAANGDFERYFSHFADRAIYMGTDADEYWTVSEFKKYARKPFSDDTGWKFTSVRRHVYISESGKVAWFDEYLKSRAFGLVRGSGVLVRTDTTWKIVHYNLSLPVPNSIVYEVVELIKTERKRQRGKVNK